MRFFKRHKKSLFQISALCFAVVLTASILYLYSFKLMPASLYAKEQSDEGEKRFIKWVDYSVPYAALDGAYNAEVRAHEKGKSVKMTDVLALLATKYGGNWNRFKTKDLSKIVQGLESGEQYTKLREAKYFAYFDEVMNTVLARFVGEYQIETFKENGEKKLTNKYGLIAFSPIAQGFNFTHYDDFGAGRSYGYKRKHLGHDIMGAVGTPIVAVEGGIVEEMGWNRYGGWRIGIRSHDQKRYYYYAHLRRDKPFNTAINKGDSVKAGEVIGYLGQTGYSTKENTNNINVPHLHFGMQLIFDQSQKEGAGEIWIDVYNIFLLLQRNKSTVVYDNATKDYYKKYKITLNEN